MQANTDPPAPICSSRKPPTQRDKCDDPVRGGMDVEREGNDTDGVGMAAPSAGTQPPPRNPAVAAALEARQARVVGQRANAETRRRVDGREAAWRAWCGKKGIDADPTVDKVREYLLDEWVDVAEGQKMRVSGKKGRGPAPWHGCCASDICCVRD